MFVRNHDKCCCPHRLFCRQCCWPFDVEVAIPTYVRTRTCLSLACLSHKPHILIDFTIFSSPTGTTSPGESSPAALSPPQSSCSSSASISREKTASATLRITTVCMMTRYWSPRTRVLRRRRKLTRHAYFFYYTAMIHRRRNALTERYALIGVLGPDRQAKQRLPIRFVICSGCRGRNLSWIEVL